MPRDGFKQVDPATYGDWDNSAWGQKASAIRARPVAEGTRIETVMKDGHKETGQTVKDAGSFLITNPGGEEYAISGDKFRSRYEAVPGEPESFRPLFAPVEFVPVKENVSFTASWGEEMFIKAGGVVVKETGAEGKFYGIQKDEFASTYGLTTAPGAERPANLEAMKAADADRKASVSPACEDAIESGLEAFKNGNAPSTPRM